jgi:nicotinamidase/pyrazinamidase
MDPVKIEPTDALVVVDVQNDFLPGGSLAVPEGDRVLEPINALMPQFPRVYATRDWHPRNTKHFAEYGGTWPVHCVQNTPGAEFSPRLATDQIDVVVSTGFTTESEGYSGFDGTGLEDSLRSDGIARVFVCGLATDYCVKATALDAKRHGFETYVLTDAIAAVNVNPGDEERSLEELRAAGIRLIESRALLASLRAPA